MPKLAIVTDYFSGSGLGNYLRSKEIYKISLKLNFDSKLFKYDEFIKNRKIYDVILLDLPLFDYTENFKKNYKNSLIISLDHYNKFFVDANIALFKKTKFAKYNFVNLKYAVIRNEFKKKKNINLDSILISIGSSDILNKTKLLKKNFFPYFKKILIIENYMKKHFKKNRNQLFLKLIEKCKVVAVNGGTTMMEMIYLNKLVFVYPQNKFERSFAKYLKLKKFKIFINPKLNRAFIQSLKFIKQNNTYFDKLGANRILLLIKKLYSLKKKSCQI